MYIYTVYRLHLGPSSFMLFVMCSSFFRPVNCVFGRLSHWLQSWCNHQIRTKQTLEFNSLHITVLRMFQDQTMNHFDRPSLALSLACSIMYRSIWELWHIKSSRMSTASFPKYHGSYRLWKWRQECLGGMLQTGCSLQNPLNEFFNLSVIPHNYMRMREVNDWVIAFAANSAWGIRKEAHAAWRVCELPGKAGRLHEAGQNFTAREIRIPCSLKAAKELSSLE